MAKIYKTALGKQIDIDHLALTNEHVIAVGNYKVNARGDELGAGGKIIKTRDQIMKEYYALNTPVAVDPPTVTQAPVAPVRSEPVKQPFVQPAPVVADPIVYNPAAGLDDEDEDEPVIPEQKVAYVDVGNTPITADVISPIAEAVKESSVKAVATVDPTLPVSAQPAMRGSLASSVAKTAVVTQVEKLPPKKANGVQRF